MNTQRTMISLRVAAIPAVVLARGISSGAALATGAASGAHLPPSAVSQTRVWAAVQHPRPHPLVGTWSNVQQNVEYHWTYRPDHTLVYVEAGRTMWRGRWREIGRHRIEELLVYDNGRITRRRANWKIIDGGRGVEFSDPSDPNSLPGLLYRVHQNRTRLPVPQGPFLRTRVAGPESVSINLDRHPGQYRVDKRGTVFLDPYGSTPLRFLVRNGGREPVTVQFAALRYRGRKPAEGLVIRARGPKLVVVPPRATRSVTVEVHCKEVKAEPATFVFRLDEPGCRWFAPYTLRYQPDPESE